ncbi:MAG: hypothetical protein HeimC3_44100 [Candidatus Heimdallarchaeota archaeon LC_3]|nr:MAG: hypothetical protein HeimC3_44100 [Candidatus Heimdallarchaeota archaeon LC_3]
MISYPKYIDSNVVRSVSITTFVLSLLIFLSETGSLRINVSWVLLLLFFDFILRYIHPKLSPNVRFHGLINNKLLKNKTKQSFSPPKRFAILIGIIITGLMVLTKFVIIFQELFVVMNIFLLVASFLQAFYDYCVGCEVFDLLIRIGVKKQPNFENPIKFIKQNTR